MIEQQEVVELTIHRTQRLEDPANIMNSKGRAYNLLEYIASVGISVTGIVHTQHSSVAPTANAVGAGL